MSMAASLNITKYAVLDQCENFNGISNVFSISALTQIHGHQLKALLYLLTKGKTESTYYADLHEFKKIILSLKLPDDWQISDKKNHIFQKITSYEISIDIYVSEELEFIIPVFFWCILSDHEIYTKYKKAMKNITLSNLIKVISNYNIYYGMKREQAKKKNSHLPFKLLFPVQFNVCF